MNKITLELLASFPDQLEANFALFPTAFRHWAPPIWDGVPSEALTAIEQVCHVRDIEIDGYQKRLRRTLEEENPFLPSIDTDALARERRYAQTDPREALSAFRAARLRTLDLLASIEPLQFERAAHFEGYGPVTLAGLVHFLCSHDQQHLAGLQWLLGKMDVLRAG